MSMPGTTEKLSHGQPTFFARNGVFAMFADHHHRAEHVAVWLPAAPGVQEALIANSPSTYFRPPYVGVSGWVGVDLDHLDDDELAGHIHDAWQLIDAKKKKPRRS